MQNGGAELKGEDVASLLQFAHEFSVTDIADGQLFKSTLTTSVFSGHLTAAFVFINVLIYANLQQSYHHYQVYTDVANLITTHSHQF